MEKTTQAVTSGALRNMAMGDTLTFNLPSADAINSGKAIAYRVQHSLRCKFTVSSDYAGNRLTITKRPIL